MNFISPSFKKVLWPVLFMIPFSASFSASIKTYFNQNPKNSYTDPYRHINRPGDDLEKVIIEHILNAKKSILIAVQELRLPLVAQALMSKRAQGLDIRVVLEHDYNNTVLRQKDREVNEHDASKLRDLIALVDINKNGLFEKSELESRDAVYMLKNAQIPLMDDTADGTAGSGLMHHKFIIIDGKKTIISTANFTPSCIHGDITNPSTRGNANSMTVIESVGVAKVFTDEFSQLWGNGRRGNFGQRKTYRGPQTISVSGTKITIQFSPTSRNFSWEESVNGLIGKHLRSATDSVHAALFVFSDQKLSQTLEEASTQGAHFGFIIEPNFAFRPYSELLDLLGVEFLNDKCSLEPDNSPWRHPIREAGAAYLSQGDVLHHKFGVIDQKTVIVGSQNWSESANYINDETLVVIEDSSIAKQFDQEYARLVSFAKFGLPSWLLREMDRQQQICRNQGFNI